jgi:hypothetical protein
MNGLVKFFQIPIVKFCIHVFIITGLVINLYNLYNLYTVNISLKKNQAVFESLVQQNTESKNEKDYFNSDIYREKYAKSSGFKTSGEEVIDTSIVETVELDPISYAIDKNSSNQNNLEKWWSCLFSINSDTYSNSLNNDSSIFGTITPQCKK